MHAKTVHLAAHLVFAGVLINVWHLWSPYTNYIQ